MTLYDAVVAWLGNQARQSQQARPNPPSVEPRDFISLFGQPAGSPAGWSPISNYGRRLNPDDPVYQMAWDAIEGVGNRNPVSYGAPLSGGKALQAMGDLNNPAGMNQGAGFEYSPLAAAVSQWLRGQQQFRPQWPGWFRPFRW